MRFPLRFVLVSLSLVAGFVQADPITQKLRSEYRTIKPLDMTLKTLVVGEREALVAAMIVVSEPSCSGSFSGVGTVEGSKIIVRAYKPEEADQNCALTLELDATGKTVTVKENNCLYYHGAGCSFEGRLTAK